MTKKTASEESVRIADWLDAVAANQDDRIGSLLKTVSQLIRDGKTSTKIRLAFSSDKKEMSSLEQAIKAAVPSLRGAERLTGSVIAQIKKIAAELQESGFEAKDVRRLSSVLESRYDWFRELTLGMITQYIHEVQTAPCEIRHLAHDVTESMHNLPHGYCPEWVRDVHLRGEIERSGFESLGEKQKESVLYYYMRMKGFA